MKATPSQLQEFIQALSDLLQRTTYYFKFQNFSSQKALKTKPSQDPHSSINDIRIPLGFLNSLDKLYGFTYDFAINESLQDLATYRRQNQIRRVRFINCQLFDGFSNHENANSLKDFLLSQSQSLQEIIFDSKNPA